MIGYWRDTVYLSVCLSVSDEVYCGALGRCRELKVVYTDVFIGRDFLFTCSNTFDAGRIIWPQNTANG